MIPEAKGTIFSISPVTYHSINCQHREVPWASGNIQGQTVDSSEGTH